MRPVILLTKFIISAVAIAGLTNGNGGTPSASTVTKAGTSTKGGIAQDAAILRVTNLSDDGPGSLRAAIAQEGARVILFDVGGTIALKSDLKITSPYLTIAGQTAPSPGITLTGASLRIRSHDVVVQHIAVRPGPGSSPEQNDNRDAISIDGSPNGGKSHQSFHVRLENVSASWSVDELISLWYATTHSITIRDSIAAEALDDAGHPKGSHSMGLLVGTNIKGVELTGNLLVSNKFRNPAISQGSTTFIANNYIVNPGQNAIHFYPRDLAVRTSSAIVNNYIRRGSDSQKRIKGILIPDLGGGRAAVTQAFIQGNKADLGSLGVPVWTDPSVTLVKNPPVQSLSWRLIDAADVPARALRYAGSRPSNRNPVDRKLLEQIRAGSARIIDLPPKDLGATPPKSRRALVPDNPFDLTADGRTRLESWLCAQHLGVGGAPSKECPEF